MTVIAPTNIAVTAGMTDAVFQAWINAIHAAFVTAGWVQTADTGQLASPATVAHPTVNATSAGYEIWRMADALQATAPIFVKIEYGTGGNTTGQNNGYWITIGTGSDGAGAITGVMQARTGSGTSVTAVFPNGTFTVVGGGASNRIALAWGVLATNNANIQNFLIIERTKDGTLADTTVGVLAMIGLQSTTAATAIMRDRAGVGYSGIGGGGLFPDAALAVMAAVYGNDVAVISPTLILGRPIPFIGIIGYLRTQIPVSNVFSATNFGVARNYYACGIIGGLNGLSSTVDFAILNE